MRKPKYRKQVKRDRGFVEFNGRRHYLPGPFKSDVSLAAYRAFLRQHGFLNAPAPEGAPRHVVGLINAFMDWAETVYPLGPRSEYMNCKVALNKHLHSLDAKTLVVDYTPARLKELQKHLSHRKLKRGYINGVCARVKRMFKWGVGEGLVPETTYNALALVPGVRKGRTAAVESESVQPIEWEQVEAVLHQLTNQLATMLLLQWHTGVRSQSICRATPEQFNTSTDPWEWRPRHKTESTHDLVVYVGPQAQELLRPLLAKRKADEYLFAPARLNGARAANMRAFYDSVSYRQAVVRAQERINRDRIKAGMEPLPLWTPHQVRHGKATLVRAKYGLEAAQATTGHATLSAAQIYAQRSSELARRVARETG